MAEARSATTISDTRRGVVLNVNDEGLVFTFSLRIPPLDECLRLAVKQFRRTTNRIKNGLYPLAPIAAVALVILLVSVVLLVDESNWFRSGTIATWIWNFSSWFPWLETPRSVRIAILAVYTGFVALFILAAIQRYLLKLLLRSKVYLYSARKPSVWLKLWGAAVTLLSGRKPMTYSFQNSLPALPLPSLKDTVSRYLSSVRPMMPAEEFDSVSALASKFLVKEGPGLQRILRLQWLISRNYVSDWWEKYVYLRGRDPIMVNSNYYILDQARLEDAPTLSQVRILPHAYQFAQ